MTEPMDVDSLFSGSTRLGLLLGAMELPWEKVAPFVAAFPGEFARYQEFSVSSGVADLGLMTRGDSKDFTHRVAHFMETRGVDEEPLRRLLVTARYFEHKNLFFKVEVGAGGIEEMSWYVRRRPDLVVARAWLAEAGVEAPGLALFDEVAAVLGKRTVHFLAMSHGVGAPVFKAYFSQPEDRETPGRLEAAARLCGVEDSSVLRDPRFVGHTAFLSFGFQDGRPLSGAKVDVHDLEPDHVGSLGGDWGGRLVLLLELTKRDRVDYAGFRLVPGQPLAVRAYSTRDLTA